MTANLWEERGTKRLAEPAPIVTHQLDTMVPLIRDFPARKIASA
jgi:hypothetical protein